MNSTLKIALSAALGVGAVIGTGTSARADDPNIAGPTTFVRVLHAVSGGPKVDVYIDGEKKLNDYAYGGVSKYLRLKAGYHTFSIRSNKPARVLLSGARTFKRGEFYTLSAYGLPYSPKILTFQDSGGSVAYNQARLTFFHLSPSLKPVEVIATTKNGRTYRLFSRLRYGQIRASYVPAVPMTIRMRVNGRTVKTIEGVEPRAGRKYAAYAIGQAGLDFKVLLDTTASQ